MTQLPQPNILAPLFLMTEVEANPSHEKRGASSWIHFKGFPLRNSIELDTWDEKRNPMARMLTEEYVRLLAKALETGHLEEKDIHAFLTDPHLKRKRMLTPSNAIYSLDNLSKKRRSSGKKRRNVCRQAQQAWFQAQKHFTQYASGFYNAVSTACGTQEEWDDLYQACILLGIKMIKESHVVEPHLKEAGLRIYFKLTEKSVAIQLDARLGNAANEIQEILSAASTSYTTRMTTMLDLVNKLDTHTLEDFHYIAKYQVTAIACKLYQQLGKIVHFSEQVQTNFKSKLHENLTQAYAQICLSHCTKIAKCPPDEVTAEIERLKKLYATRMDFPTTKGGACFQTTNIAARVEAVAQLQQLVKELQGNASFIIKWEPCAWMLQRAINPIHREKLAEHYLGRAYKLNRSLQVLKMQRKLVKKYWSFMNIFLALKPAHTLGLDELMFHHPICFKLASQIFEIPKLQSDAAKKWIEKKVLKYFVVRD